MSEVIKFKRAEYLQTVSFTSKILTKKRKKGYIEEPQAQFKI